MPRQLVLIKIIHSVIWLFFVSLITYVLYSGLSDQITLFTWAAIIGVILEGVVLGIFKNQCPLTILARKYSSSQKENFDIFLPLWLAKNNKLIFTGLFVVGLLLVLVRYYA